MLVNVFTGMHDESCVLSRTHSNMLHSFALNTCTLL